MHNIAALNLLGPVHIPPSTTSQDLSISVPACLMDIVVERGLSPIGNMGHHSFHAYSKDDNVLSS